MKFGKLTCLLCATLVFIIAGCTNFTQPSTSTTPVSTPPSSSSQSVVPPSSESSPSLVAVTSISLSVEKTTLTVDESTNIAVSVLPLNAHDKTYTVQISDTSIIGIEGLTVTALKEGTTSIKVISNDGKKEDSQEITVLRNIPKLGETAMINKLSESIYTDDFRPENEDILTETEKIGIDKSLFENQTLYPVPSDAKVYRAKDYDISGDDVLNASRLNNLISSIAFEDGIKVIEFEDETYRFGTSITGRNVQDLYLVGKANTKFIYDGWITYVHFADSSNIHINSITFDMDPSPSIVGTIKEVIDDTATSATIVLDIPAEFDLTHQLYTNWNIQRKGSYAEYIYDETYGTYIPDLAGNLYYTDGIKSMVYEPSTRELKVTLSKNFFACSYKTPKIGNKAGIGFTVYDNHGFHFENCTDTYIEDLTCYVAAGMGVRFDGGSDAYLNKVRFMRDENRFLTCTADILHTAQLSGDFIITNSILEGSHDDAINVKTFYTKINSIKANVVNVLQTQIEVVIDYEVGDTIDVYNPDGFAYCNTYTVQEVKKYGNNFELTLDKALPRSYVNYLVGNVTKATHMTLENSLISNKRNRGILLQGKESVIRNCTFQNVLMGGIQVLAVADSFNEAIVPTDITIENTKFLNCVDALRVFSYDRSGKSTPGTIHDVVIKNNYFSRSKGQEIFIQGSKNVSVLNNLIMSAAKSHTVRVVTSSDITVADNNAYFISAITNYSFLVSGDDVTSLLSRNNKYKELEL